jgi:hypothetical protein
MAAGRATLPHRRKRFGTSPERFPYTELRMKGVEKSPRYVSDSFKVPFERLRTYEA